MKKSFEYLTTKEIYDLNEMERDNYFRVASDVIVDGKSLADMRIEAGMAVKYDGGKKAHKWCDSINE